MPRIVTYANGDEAIPGPAIGQPVTTSLLGLMVSGRRTGPMLKKDGVTPLDVIGDDERTRRTDTNQAPLRMICSIEIALLDDGSDMSPVATGWLVGPRTVLTAGHVLWWHQKAKHARVVPGRDRAREPFQALSSDLFHFSPLWMGSAGQKPENDIAAIRLPEPIGEQLGWFGIANASDTTLQGRNINIAGYPADVDGHDVKRCTELWHETNHIKSLKPDRIFYDLDTSGGQSGAPVLLWPDPNRPGAAPLGVGIHSRGIQGADGLNSATRINGEKLEMIAAWIAEDNHA